MAPFKTTDAPINSSPVASSFILPLMVYFFCAIAGAIINKKQVKINSAFNGRKFLNGVRERFGFNILFIAGLAFSNLTLRQNYFLYIKPHAQRTAQTKYY